MRGNLHHISLLIYRSHFLLYRFSQFVWQLGSNDPGVLLPSDLMLTQQKIKESYWQKFVQDWFLPQAVVRLILGDGQGAKEFGEPELCVGAIDYRITEFAYTSFLSLYSYIRRSSNAHYPRPTSG